MSNVMFWKTPNTCTFCVVGCNLSLPLIQLQLGFASRPSTGKAVEMMQQWMEFPTFTSKTNRTENSCNVAGLYVSQPSQTHPVI